MNPPSKAPRVCIAKTSSGATCKKPPMKGLPYCHSHVTQATGRKSASAKVTHAMEKVQGRLGARPSDEVVRVDNPAKTLTDFQSRAARAFREFSGDRASIRAACGSGKTILSEEIIKSDYIERAEAGEESPIYVVMTPSIKLSQQSRESFARDGNFVDHRAFSIHDGSVDLDVNRSAKDVESGEKAAFDVAEIVRFLTSEGEGPRVLFTTYRSHEKLIEAQKQIAKRHGPDAGRVALSIFDEAHTLAGEYGAKKRKVRKANADDEFEESPEVERSDLPKVFSDLQDGLRIEKRVFLSATPKGYIPGKRAVTGVGAEVIERKIHEGSIVDVTNHNKDLFGEEIASMSFTEAIAAKSLVPLEVVESRTRVDEISSFYDVEGNPTSNGLTLTALTSANAILDSALYDPRRRVMLNFLPSVNEAETVTTLLPHVARARSRSLIGRSLSDQEAKEILSQDTSPEEEKVAARLVLLAEGTFLAASSKVSMKDRDKIFEALDHPTPADCACARPDGTCYCLRVVSNVDLFGQGVDKPLIDTVVMANPTKTGDEQFIQAVGRANRRAPGKESGLLVIPNAVDAKGRPLDPRLSDRTRDSLSRLLNDSPGATERPIAHDHDIAVTHVGNRGQSQGTYQLQERLRSERLTDQEIADHVAYQFVKKSFDSAVKSRSFVPAPERSELENVKDFATATYSRGYRDPLVTNVVTRFVSRDLDEVDVEHLRAKASVMLRRAQRMDSDFLTETETALTKEINSFRDPNNPNEYRTTDFPSEVSAALGALKIAAKAYRSSS